MVVGSSPTPGAISGLRARRAPTEDLALDAERPRPTGPGFPAPRDGPRRWILLTLGLLFVALGTVGAFLPVLPTTPFLLLASACFARSSPAFQRRLMESRVFGPYLRQWAHDRTIPREAKRKAYGLVVLTFTLSILAVDGSGPRWMLAGLGAALLAFLAWLPVTRARPPVKATRDERS